MDTTHPVLTDVLSSLGYECEIHHEKNYDWFAEHVANYEGIIVRSRIRIDKALIFNAVNLKFIGRLGSGLENIDVAYAVSRGIECFNSPEGNRDAVGEHAVGMLLDLFHNITRANNEVKNGVWNREANRGMELFGKVVGIIGYGNMGSAFAKRLNGFGCRVLAFDKYKTGFSDQYVRESDMDEIFRETDILSFHVPLKEDTRKLFNTDYLSRFSKKIWIINTARGHVVETGALVTGLTSGKVLGACLDVLEYESLSFDSIAAENYPMELRYLMNAGNVIMSPHIAGLTAESHFKLASVLADKIKTYILK